MLTRVTDIAVSTGLVLAAWLLWRAVRNSRLLRYFAVALGLVALFCAGHFFFAALLGIPLRPTATGGSRFSEAFAESALLAALVIVPAGWVVSVVKLGIPRFREGTVAPAAMRCAALTACTGLLVAQFAQSTTDGGSRTPEQRLATLQSSLQAIADGDRDLPRDRWDPDYVVATLGRNPQNLFRWVQQNTYWIPYRGVLRGPVGVLNDRQGNSLDRGLLLATLLEKAGFTVRLARGEIKRDEAVAMLTALVAERSVSFAEPAETAEPLPGIRDAALQYHLDADGIERTLTAQEEHVKRVAQELDSRVEQQTKYLLQSIPRPAKGADWKNSFESNVSALQDHWWVQVQDGSRWADLDLFVGDGTHSVAVAAPKETFAVHDLADALYHQVIVRVVAERWADGATTEHNTLEYTLRPAEVIGQPIVLQFAPSEWLSDAGSQLRAEPDIRAAALKTDEWAAGLAVGGRTVASAFLRDSGDDTPPPRGGLFGLGAALDSTMNQGRRSPTPTHFLTAVWIEYEIRVPGEKPRTIRRTIFDLLGPAVRATGVHEFQLDDTKKLTRSLALGMKTEVLPQACQLAPEFVAHLTSAPMVANQKLLSAVLKPEFSPESDEAKRMLADAVPPTSALVGLAYMRLEWNHVRRDVYIDHPNILTRHQYLAVKPSGIVYDDAIDIVNNQVGVNLAAPDAFAVRLQQGVRDTNTEALLFGGEGVGNTGDAYSESHDWLTLTSIDRSSLEQLKFSSDTRRSITQDLDTDSLVVTPRVPLHRRNEEFVGWWRIDSKTGAALGVGENGWGQDAAEESMSARAAAEWFKAFFWENGMCHVYGQTLNATLVYKEMLVGGWHPTWTAAGPKSKDSAEVFRENARMCLILGMVAGYLATLPLLMISIRNTRIMRRLRWTEEWLEKPRPPAREPCLISQALPFTGSVPIASFSILPALAVFFARTLPCIPSNGPGPGGTTREGLRGHTPPEPPPKNPTYNDFDMDMKAGQTQPKLGKKGIPKRPIELPTPEELDQAYLEYRKAYKASADALGEYLQYRDPAYGHAIDPQKLEDLWNTAEALAKESDALQARYDNMERLYDYFGPGQGSSGASQAVGSAGAGNALKGGGSQ